MRRSAAARMRMARADIWCVVGLSLGLVFVFFGLDDGQGWLLTWGGISGLGVCGATAYAVVTMELCAAAACSSLCNGGRGENGRGEVR